ncbi:MAG: tetratricopeptide repeat protein [Gemmatimonadota bacterium]|nr:MAG: tetratricopeptide repeat protein [Gemmatimonadota bacterium]
MSRLKRLIGEIHRRSLWQILAAYLAGSWIVLQAADTATAVFGLPDWVPQLSAVVCVVGLLPVLATAVVQRHGPFRAPPAGEVSAHAWRRWLTWRYAFAAVLLAFGVLGAGVAGYMAMRTLGIGPVGTLVAAGVLDEGDQVILADFADHTGDSTLAVAVTEAFRVDLSQSPTVGLMQPGDLRDALELVERDPSRPLTVELAREVAVREGVKAVIAGEINAVGSGYVLSTRVVLPESGDVIEALRETAEGSTEIIEAIDRLSKRLRERIGESLRTIRSSKPLPRVTTHSLDALRLYAQAGRAYDYQGDVDKALSLLEQAIALDTAFAAAYGAIGAYLTNLGGQPTRRDAALTKAFEHRDRLTERERCTDEAMYYWQVLGDRGRAIDVYETWLEKRPDDLPVVNNLGVLHAQLRNWEDAEVMFRQLVDAESDEFVAHFNLAAVQGALGRYDEALETLDLTASRFPDNPIVEYWRAHLAASSGNYSDASATISALREAKRGDPSIRAETSRWLAHLAFLQGKLTEAERHHRDRMDANEARGLRAGYLISVLELAFQDVLFRNASETALRRAEAALQRQPLDWIPPADRPYLTLADLLARAGRIDRARQLMAEYEETTDPNVRDRNPSRFAVAGTIALAEGRVQEAIAHYRRLDEENECPMCVLPSLAEAYDAAGATDSARAIYKRYVDTPWPVRIWTDSWQLASAYERLGALYEQRGDRQMVIYYYGKFAELWQDADPELQPRVEAARRAIEALSPDT